MFSRALTAASAIKAARHAPACSFRLSLSSPPRAVPYTTMAIAPSAAHSHRRITPPTHPAPATRHLHHTNHTLFIRRSEAHGPVRPLPSPPSQSPSTPVGAPRLVWEFTGAPNFLAYTGLNVVQAVVWSGIYVFSWIEPDVPTWWGALGVTVSIASAGIIWLRARRVLTEIAIYPDGQTFRLRSTSPFNKPVFQDVRLSQIGSNPDPRPKSGEAPKYFMLRVKETTGFYVLDIEGEVFDLRTLNRLLGYDVRSTIPASNPEALRLAPSARIQDRQMQDQSNDDNQTESVSFQRGKK